MDILVRSLLRGQGGLCVDGVSDRDGRHAHGLGSMRTVNLMSGIGQAPDIEFPARAMTRRVFSAVASIDAVLRRLSPGFESMEEYGSGLQRCA